MSNIDILNSNPDTTRESYLFTDHPSTPNGNEGSAKWHINTLFHKGVENYRSQIATLSGAENKMLYRNYNDGWSTWEEVGNGVITGDTSGSTGVNPDVEQELVEIRELILSLINGAEGQPGLNDELQALIKRLDDLMIQADFTTISAKDAYLDRIHGGSIDIINASIDSANINLASINTLLAGNITAENIKAGSITAQSGVIANGAILNGMIVNLDVSKLLAGNISTNKFNIISDSGNLSMKENTLKVWDTTGQERVSLGKNGTDYNLLVRGLDGQTVLFGSDGVTKAGVTEGAIDDSKVDVNANINGGKLNINSVVSHINTGTTAIESTHINLDGQRLDVAFAKFDSDLNTLLTDFTIEQGKISAIITDTSLTKQTVSTMQQDLTGFSQSLTSLEETTGTLSSNLATATQDLTGFKTTVSESYYTKQEVEDKVQEGNLLYDAYVLAQEELERIKFEAYKDGVITPVERQAITDALEVVKVAKEKYEAEGKEVIIVGRNLVLKSDVSKTSTSNTLANYTLSRKLITDKYYTISLKGTLGTGKSNFIAYMDNINNILGEFTSVGENIHTLTFKAYNTVPNVSKLLINTLGTGSANSAIEWVKLEAGDTMSDWTVAPEDTAELISTASSEISQLSDAIDLKVSKDGVISAINLAPGNVKIEAKKITLQGAVTVLSDITGSLGTITAGDINGTNIYSSNIYGTTISGGEFNSTKTLSNIPSWWGSYKSTTTMLLSDNNLGFYETKNFTNTSYTVPGSTTNFNKDGVTIEEWFPEVGVRNTNLSVNGVEWTSDVNDNLGKWDGYLKFGSSGIDGFKKMAISSKGGVEILDPLYASSSMYVSGEVAIYGYAQFNVGMEVKNDVIVSGEISSDTLDVNGLAMAENFTARSRVTASSISLGGTLIKSHIHDYGYSGSWEWIQYTDGTMICYRSSSINITMPTSAHKSGLHALTSPTYTFPKTFYNVPNVQASCPASEVISFSPREVSTTSVNFRIFTIEYVSYSRSVNIVAIGRWKV